MSRVIVVDSPEEAARRAADVIEAIVLDIREPVIVPATGDTPMLLYWVLGERVARGTIDLSSARVFQLDEYAGVGRNDPRSLYQWMARSFVTPLGIPEARVVAFDSTSDHIDEACESYAREAHAAGGFDLAILGLGPNGHLGYNEPPSVRDAPTRVVKLSDESRERAREYFPGMAPPSHGVTAGMDLLLASRHILLLVTGARKAEILRRTLHEPPSPWVPASYLQLLEAVTVIADREAASLLPV